MANIIRLRLNSLQMNMEAHISPVKVDICFANGLKSVKKNMLIQVCLHILQFVTMAIMIPLDILIFRKGDKNDEVLTFFITATCITFLNMTAKLTHLVCQLGNPDNIIAIATDLNHIIVDEPQSERLGSENIEGFNVSADMYNVQNNMTEIQATPAIRQMLQPALANMIKAIALSRDPITRCTMSVGSGISFALFIYGIVVMSLYEMKPVQIVVMVLFLLSEFIIQIQVFLCIIIMALIPVLCIFCCIFLCCCRQGEKQAKLPQPIPATIDIIQQSEGAPCSICYQSIMLEEQVIVLPCSAKHVFHDKCIAAWTAVKPTCPMCRHDLSQ